MAGKHGMGPWQTGFTMIELIVVLVLLGIVSVYAMPKLMSAISMQDDAWRDELVGALRFAQKGAVARRRLTCVNITNTTIAITSASTNPASSCASAINGPDGSATFATAANGNAVTTVSTPGVIYFQPDGRVTTDGAGANAATRTISATGVTAITVFGETGHVE
jgi:MSHA pilin protein MshC